MSDKEIEQRENEIWAMPKGKERTEMEAELSVRKMCNSIYAYDGIESVNVECKTCGQSAFWRGLVTLGLARVVEIIEDQRKDLMERARVLKNVGELEGVTYNGIVWEN